MARRNETPASYTVLSDESGTHERYLGFGAILLPTQAVEGAEVELEAFCERRGLSRELAWKECGTTDVDRYCEFVDHLWSISEGPLSIDFRSMVVDTGSNPLKHPESGADTDESGFYRFYHTFLSRSAKIVAPDVVEVRFYVAPLSDQYEYRTEILQKTLQGNLRTELDAKVVVEVERDAPKLRRLHQLADVLLGAVTFKFNERTPSSKKRRIVETIEARVGKPIDSDFRPAERPFNVWGWSPVGAKRWVPGALGRV